MSKRKPRPRDRRIPSATVPGAKPLQFSFKYLDTENDKFPVSGCSDEYWSTLVRELKRYSAFTPDQFVEEDNADGRHVVYFEQTSEPAGFKILGEGEDSVPWQFAIGPRQMKWRVAGFILEDNFFIVWLDSTHALYP